jgi:serine protease SohB
LEFLAEYGLFLAKVVTFVVAFAVVVAIIVSAASKGHKSSDDAIEIRNTNEEFDEVETAMRENVLDEESLKQLNKEKKKKQKTDKKAAKVKQDKKPRLFVTSFDGDIKASHAEQLRRVVSAILSVAEENDEVLIKLESQGGMVHSYGFASSQLARIRDKGIALTICVDKVAASGGYMMACVANKILAAPFSIIGSIGVVAQLPNFHKLLEKNDIDYEMYTAGEYKRTLTMFGENTDQGRKKFLEDIEDTHELFKDFIARYREKVDIAKVATGEVWFGTRALELDLIDSIQTSDDYLFDARKEKDIYEVSISEKKTLMEKLGITIEHTVEALLSKAHKYASTRYFS